MNKRRLKAFTIMELTVTMLLVAIVIGITYSVYNIVSKSYQSFQHKNEDIAVLNRVNELLSKDFLRSDSIFKTANGIIFRKKQDTVSYHLDIGFITRTSNSTDTFKIKTADINMLFESQSLNDSASLSGRNLMDELQFNILLQDEKIPYHYHKIYSSENLIEEKNNAVN